MPYFLQNFNKAIGSPAINEFPEGRISENRLPMLLKEESRVILIELLVNGAFDTVATCVCSRNKV